MKDQAVWHLSRNGNQWGPVSHNELLRRAARGEVLTDDLLWKAGFTTWKSASSVPGLLKPPGPPPLPALPPTTPAGSRGFLGLSHLWRGEKPLWEAFWIYFAAGSILASIAGLLLAAGVQYAVEHVILARPIGGTGALLLYVPLSYLAPSLYRVFAGIGAWRSASWRRLTGILARVWITFVFGTELLVFGGLLYGTLTGRI